MTNLILPKINILSAFTSELKQRDYVLPSFPIGKVGLLASSGGTGKSFYALQAAFQVAVGVCCDFNLSGAKVKNKTPASVLYVSLEDESLDIEFRLQALWNYWESNKTKQKWLNNLANQVDIYGLAGQGAVLIDTNLRVTNYFNEIHDRAMKMQGLRMIVIDTLRRAHDCDENDNGSMSQVLRYFEYLAKSTGAAVLLLHHESKTGAIDSQAGASAVRGASSIVDNARYVLRLQTMTSVEAKKREIDENERRYWVQVTLEKSNYGTPQNGAWLKREDGGVLIADNPPMSSNQNFQSIDNIGSRNYV
jgi:RecA-family ATPase